MNNISLCPRWHNVYSKDTLSVPNSINNVKTYTVQIRNIYLKMKYIPIKTNQLVS